MALTEKYVSSSAAGGGTGLTAGSPLTFSEMVTAINAGTEAGSRFNVLAGTYTRSATDTISGGGSSTSPVIIRGYSSVIGDGYLGRTNGNGALITTNMPTISYASGFRLNCTGSFVLAESLNVTGTVSGVLFATGANCSVARCKSVNASTSAAAIAIQCPGTGVLIDSDAALTGASGGSCAIDATASATRCLANRVTSPTIGIKCASSAVVAFNVGYVGTVPISMTSTSGAPAILYNTITGGSSDGVNIITGATSLQCVVGNIVTDNGGYGINGVSAANAIFAAYNRLRDNTSGNTNLATDWLTATSYGHVTSGNGTSDYTNSAGSDYSLVASSPAVGAGIPKYASVGALQRSQTGGGGISRGRML